MKMTTMNLTNSFIYDKAVNLVNNFNSSEITMPIAACYSIEKNKETLRILGEDIEQHRYQIIQRYGTIQENGQFIIPQEKIIEVNEELTALLNIEQEVKIYIFKIEELKNVELTPTQMKAIMFMIDEGEEN